MATLRKIRVNSMEPVLRAVFGEEPATYLAQFEQGGNGLDNCVTAVMANMNAGARFYRLENEFGALVGFMVLGRKDDKDMILNFHLRRIFRGTEYLQAFWELIAETYNNSFFTSVGAAQYADQTKVKKDFKVVNQLQSTGKDFEIIKEYIFKDVPVVDQPVIVDK
jgi:hypothetical protein